MQTFESITLPAKLENLGTFIKFVSDCAKKQGINSKKTVEIEISAEEVLVNIFNYAYQDMDGDVEIICKSGDNNRFVIEIKDRGIPFNLLELKEPETKLDIEERKIGGLGIFIVKKLMDDVQHRYEEGKNIVTLIVSKQAI
jgi:anti-sigma regulatory factor (Ser/Thr protein kinase)